MLLGCKCSFYVNPFSVPLLTATKYLATAQQIQLFPLYSCIIYNYKDTSLVLDFPSISFSLLCFTHFLTSYTSSSLFSLLGFFLHNSLPRVLFSGSSTAVFLGLSTLHLPSAAMWSPLCLVRPGVSLPQAMNPVLLTFSHPVAIAVKP